MDKLGGMLLPGLTITAAPPTFTPRLGAVVSVSGQAKPGSYLLQMDGLKPALTIRGKNLTVDFTGVTLRGSAATAWPNERKGLGLLIEGENITVKNLKATGYKVAVLARQVKGLKLIDCDLSYNWRQKLKSTPEREDAADWMSFHHNEKGEWLQHGTAAYLDRCDGFEVKGLRVTGGQSGLFLDRSNKGLVWNSDLSYNSALGIGMYRASDNRILHNRLDYNVRGFSYGVYNRGQDSAGILIFEQCHRNVFAFNSVTHGGDGFFLWAGQETMDTGKGGCNDNLLYGNDFSHAPTNGIEATFSRNVFVANRVHGCFHGFWGGYSYDSEIVGNDFKDNQRGIAIEHGQANTIAMNGFQGEDVAIALWANATQDPNWGYGKTRDTRSRDNRIIGNDFRKVALALDLRKSPNTLLSENVFDQVERPARVPNGDSVFSPLPVANTVWEPGNGSGLPGIQEKRSGLRGALIWDPLSLAKDSADLDPSLVSKIVQPLPGGMKPFLARNAPQGWSTIFVDEWGPYDFRRPFLTPEKLVEGGAPVPGGTSSGSGLRKAGQVRETGRYQILGPKGRWRVIRAVGAKLGATQGEVPGFVKLDVEKGRVGVTEVELQYLGEASTDARGIVTPAGKPVRFGFKKFFAPIAWDVAFYLWSESENPADVHANPKDFAAVLAGTPIKTLKTDRLDFAGYAFVPGLPTNHYATLANGTFTVPRGTYSLELTSDDGARVWIDDRLVIDDAWKYQGPTVYKRTVKLGGTLRIRVEHFQIDGYATLKLELKPTP